MCRNGGAVRVRGCGAGAGVRCGCGGAVQVRGAGAGQRRAGEACLAGESRGRPAKSVPCSPPGAPARARRCPGPRRCGGTPEKGRARMRQAAQKKGRRRQSASPSRPLTGLAPVRDVICQGSPCRWSARRNTRPPRPKPPPQRRGAARRRSWGGRRGPPRQKSGWCGWAL